MSRKRKSEENLEAIGVQPLRSVTRKTISQILAKPAYSSLVAEIHKRRGFQTRLYHIAAWPQTHWWDLQEWINQTQYELEQIFGPVVQLTSTQKQVHGGRVHVLGFFEIGPISPIVAPVKLGSAWRQFLETIAED